MVNGIEEINMDTSKMSIKAKRRLRRGRNLQTITSPFKVNANRIARVRSKQKAKKQEAGMEICSFVSGCTA